MSEWARIKKSTLEGIGNAIREKEGSSDLIPTAEMEARILAIKTGTDTSDATATADDIRLGKTAYVNDIKLEGTIEDYDGSFEGDGEEVDMIKRLIEARGNLDYMFYSSTITQEDLDELITDSKVENVKSARDCFENTSNLTKINLKLPNCLMYQAFAKKSSIETANFDLSNLENTTSKIALKLNYTFGDNSNLKNINLKLPKNLYTDSTIDFESTFRNCTSLELTQEQIDDIINIEIPGHTDYNSQPKNYSYTFYNCPNIKIKDLKIDIGQYNNYFYQTFYDCTGLTGNAEITKNPDYTDNRMRISRFFESCTGLNSIVIRGYKSGLANLTSVARDCTNLTNFEFYLTTNPYADFNMSYALHNCYNLKTVQLTYGYWHSAKMKNCFTNCYSLVCLKINEMKETTLNNNEFTNCYHLYGTYNETYNPYGLQDAYIYAPDSFAETLKSTTNWSSFGTQIRPLSVFNTITINGTEYACEYNQTWEQWLNSSYNTSGYTPSNTFIANDLLVYCDEGSTTPTEHESGFNFTNLLSTTIVAGGSNFTIN